MELVHQDESRVVLGRCIYCGSLDYARGSTRPLADEHVVPLSLAGTMVLGNASCRECEERTGRDEQILMRGMFAVIRNRLALPRRRKGKRPEKLPLFSYEPIPRRMDISVEDHPLTVAMPVWHPPRILGKSLAPGPNDKMALKIVYNMTGRDSVEMRDIYGVNLYTAPEIKIEPLCRFLAKMAHAYLCLRIGPRNFTPLLVNFVLGREDNRRHDFVGGGLYERRPDNTLYHLEHFLHASSFGMIWFVSIRLFGHINMPVYWVATGSPRLEYIVDTVR